MCFYYFLTFLSTVGLRKKWHLEIVTGQDLAILTYRDSKNTVGAVYNRAGYRTYNGYIIPHFCAVVKLKAGFSRFEQDLQDEQDFQD